MAHVELLLLHLNDPLLHYLEQTQIQLHQLNSLLVFLTFILEWLSSSECCDSRLSLAATPELLVPPPSEPAYYTSSMYIVSILQVHN